MKKALIVLNLEENILKNSHRELLNYISNFERLDINILILLQDEKEEVLEEIKHYDIGDITLLKNVDSKKTHSTSYVAEIENEFRKTQSEMLILDNSIFSKDIAPILAEKLDTELVNEVIEIFEEDNNFKFKKNIYGGNYQEIYTYIDGRVIITVKNNIFNGTKKFRKNSKLTMKKFELSEERVKITSTIEVERKKILPVTQADVVIAGGYALKQREDVSMLEELAEILKGSVGGTRAIVDKGYMRRSQQIGQSGKKITPNILINFGISGQRQYTAGFIGTKTVISINKDKEATIFKHSDFGIVGDLYEIVPEMIRAFRSLK